MSMDEGTPWEPPEIEATGNIGSLEHAPRLRKALEQLDTLDQQLQTLEAEMDAILAQAAVETR